MNRNASSNVLNWHAYFLSYFLKFFRLDWLNSIQKLRFQTWVLNFIILQMVWISKLFNYIAESWK